MQPVVCLTALRVAQEAVGDVDALHLGLARRALLRRPLLIEVRVVRPREPTVRAGHLLDGCVRRDAEDRVGIGTARTGVIGLTLGTALLLLLPTPLRFLLGLSASALGPRGPPLRFHPPLPLPRGRLSLLGLACRLRAPRRLDRLVVGAHRSGAHPR